MIPHNRWTTCGDYLAAARFTLDTGLVGSGTDVAAFEEELAARFRPNGAAACVSSGTAALYLALRVLRVPREGSLLIPSYACSALGNACDLAGASWFPVDVGEDADVVVHTYGAPDRRVKGTVVEDFTHAPGAHVTKLPCGSFAKASVISFGATKPLGVGSGGAVLGDKDMVQEVRAIRDYDSASGTWKKGAHFNWLWSDLPAALARARLRRLDEENAKRRAIAGLYCETLGHAMCEHEDMEVPYRYTIGVENVERAISKLAARRVEAISPLRPDELLHRRRSLPRTMFPVAEKMASRLVSLPIWPGMTASQIETVRNALAEVF